MPVSRTTLQRDAHHGCRTALHAARWPQLVSVAIRTVAVYPVCAELTALYAVAKAELIIIIIIINKTFITRKFAEAANARSVDSTEEKRLQSLFEDVQRDVR